MAGRVNVAVLTPYVPHLGINHAGGQYLYEYLVRLARAADVTLLAPNTPTNRAALAGLPEGVRALLPERGWERPNPLRRILTVPAEVVDGISLHHPVLRSMAGLIEEAGFLAAADVVEIHHAEYLPLLEPLRKMSPHSHLVALEYDVFTDVLEWTLRSPVPWTRRAIAWARLFTAPAREAALLNRCDVVECFSEKDRARLVGLGVRSSIRVIDPLVPNPVRPPGPSSDPVVLFSGAMWRPENYEGALWLATEIWPEVKRRVPAARLVIAGACPPPILTSLAPDDIQVTGRVDDIDAYYAQARVLAAALRSPAGTKFKILGALAYGVPVVTTAGAAAGVSDRCGTDGLLVADTAAEFAAALTSLLLDVDRARTLGSQGQARVRAAYDFDADVQATIARYQALSGDAPA
jgi:glycosyltransferase involved in cell wall biosynthesis